MPPVRVLVIDDEPDAREGLVHLLGGKGFIVASACDGAEGLRFARVSPPDVITLDLEMPVLDGWTFRLHQQRDPRLVEIPVIVVSACGARGNIDIDAAAVFEKPFDVDALVTAVVEHGRRYCARHQDWSNGTRGSGRAIRPPGRLG